MTPAVIIALVVISVGSGLLDFFLPAMGDDLMFWSHLGLDNYTAPDRKTLSFIAAHISGCNGRVFDYMGPVIINLLPRALASTVMGVMAGMFFYSILFAARVPRRGHVAFSMALLSITLAVMPWWDSLFLRVCQFNYSWGTTFCLLFTGLFFSDRSLKMAGKTTLLSLCLLGVCAGAAHEQTGVAMSATYILWGLHGRRYRRLSMRRKMMIAGLFFGTFLTIAAPSIWHRAAAGTVRQNLLPLLTTTLPVYLLLLMLIGMLAMTRAGRKYLGRMAATDWTVYVIAGFFAGIIAVAGGIPGRTGFFAEACAIVALAQMALTCRNTISRVAGGVIAAVCMAAISLHFAVSVRWQRQMGQEYDDVRIAYTSSADGIVYYDFSNRYDASPLTLYRVKGVADADDFWNLHALREAYRTDGLLPVVLPTSLSGITDSLTDSVTDGSTTVYSFRPAGIVMTLDSIELQCHPGPAPRVISHTQLADGRDIWIATPRVRDPGDYEQDLISEE